MHQRVSPRIPLIAFLERRTRKQVGVAVGVLALIAAWSAARSGASVLLDRWWLQTVTDSPVWSRRVAAQFELGLAAAFVVAVVLGGSVWIVLRHARQIHEPRARLIERYHQRVGPAHVWAMWVLVAYLVVHIGRAGAGQWQLWMLYRHGGDLGVPVPALGGDLGFHLFRLPFLTAASSFLRQITLFAIVVSAIGHIASGAARWPSAERRPTSVAVIHLSLLGAMFAGLQAIHEVVIARAATATNRVGTFDGPGFTEINVTRPALVVAALASVLAGAALVQGARTRRWRAPVAVVAVAATIHAVGLVVAPIAVERLVVAPSEAARQLWSIEHNIDATRTAYQLDAVDIEPVALDDVSITASDDDLSIPLFDNDQIASALQVLVGRSGTRIGDVDLEAYEIDGRVRPVYVGARTLTRAELPERGWVQEHLVYTHGDGVVAIVADTAASDGRPDLTDLPSLTPATDAPLYFGEGLDGWYAITGTKRAEAGDETYEGTGIALSSTARRLSLALATGDVQPLISSELTDRSMLLYRRSIRERIDALAPFLRLDSDPYPVIDDGHVTWVASAYTTSGTYPYAQFSANGPASFAGQNYVHASVLATVDAQSGETHLFRVDDGDDVVLEAWARAFPGLFDPIDELPTSLAPHVRYPEDLFAQQTAVLGRYHVTDPEQVFAGEGRWTISPAAANAVGGDSSGPTPAVDLLLTDRAFATGRTFAPGAAGNAGATRDELTALAIGTHSVEHPLDILVPHRGALLSPQVAQSAIDADPVLAQDITLLNANGSRVEFGPLSPVIVGDTLVWARPVVVIGTTSASVPRLYGVAVVAGGSVAIGTTIDDALRELDVAGLRSP